jgi:Ca-activated chloride channel family protein
MHFQYSKFDPSRHKDATKPFETLLDLFQQLLLISSGDVAQALKWLTELDKTYKLTESYDGYGLGDFIEDLNQKGYIKYDEENNEMVITQKSERSIRNKSLEEVFKGLKKGSSGTHKTPHIGKGTEREPETRPWQFGDDINQIDNTSTLLNVLKHSSLEKLDLSEDDLEVYDTDHHTSVSTVLMIDLSHSMILYGEDRITPAKKVALALSELIMNNYAKDSLEIIAFGDTAWEVEVKDIPYLSVGPFHTNTLAGLELARHKLQRKKYSNKQIFMITDGKPSAMFEKGRLYKNSFGLDRKIVNKVLDEAVKCRREKISITTFMIASDPYLQGFVKELTDANKGRAYYASLNELGGYIFEDYIRNRRKNVR